jgi:nicotinate-nucleotide adenylyltransferase
MTPVEARFDMVRLAVKPNPYFGVSRIEADRAGRSYTLDTLRQIRALYQGSEIYFIMGDDAVLSILTWHEPDEIARIATLLTVGRPGYARDKISELPRKIRESIITVDSPQLDISSTDIRRRTAEGRSIRYMVPEEVRRYIGENALYTDSDGELN